MENGQENMGKKCENCGSMSCGGSCGKKGCNCPHHKVMPIGIILIALTFLLGTWGIFNEGTVAVIWPVLLLIIGVTKLMGQKCSCCK